MYYMNICDCILKLLFQVQRIMSVEPDVIQMSNCIETKKHLNNSTNQQLQNGDVAAVVNGVNHIQVSTWAVGQKVT